MDKTLFLIYGTSLLREYRCFPYVFLRLWRSFELFRQVIRHVGSLDAYLVPLGVVLPRYFPYLGEGFQQGHSHRIWNCLCVVADHFHNY